MTTPNQPAPNGAYVKGDAYGSDQDPDSVAAAIRTANLAPAIEAQGEWKAQWAGNDDRLASVVSGQGPLGARMQAISDIDGFVSSFMTKNWNVTQSRTVVLPYDRQLGPAKKATVAPDGTLILKAGGLWRVDAHCTLAGYTQNNLFIPTQYPPYYYIIITYEPIAPKMHIEVHNAAGQMLTQRAADAIPNVAMYSASVFSQLNNPATIAFNHTFVLEDMPSEDDPTAPDHWAHVRVLLSYEPINTANFSFAYCKTTGGTRSSGLIASRWSRDAVNAAFVPNPPHGGDIV